MLERRPVLGSQYEGESVGRQYADAILIYLVVLQFRGQKYRPSLKHYCTKPDDLLWMPYVCLLKWKFPYYPKLDSLAN